MSTASLILGAGAFLALLAVIAAWLFRTASAPLLIKIIIPISLMVLAWVAPSQLPSILGWPVDTSFADLPPKAELIAFVAHDDEKKVSLWLMREGAPEPRAYSVELTDELKNTLRQAQKSKASGARALLVKRAVKVSNKKRPPGYMDLDGGKAPYELQTDAFQLPKKGPDE